MIEDYIEDFENRLSTLPSGKDCIKFNGKRFIIDKKKIKRVSKERFKLELGLIVLKIMYNIILMDNIKGLNDLGYKIEFVDDTKRKDSIYE